MGIEADRLAGRPVDKQAAPAGVVRESGDPAWDTPAPDAGVGPGKGGYAPGRERRVDFVYCSSLVSYSALGLGGLFDHGLDGSRQGVVGWVVCSRGFHGEVGLQTVLGERVG